MAWISLFFAGLLEIVWAYYMKQSQGFTRPVESALTLVSMTASFALLAFSMRSLPLGAAYAVWTGIGIVGASLIGMVCLGEMPSLTRIMGVVLIVAGLILVKISA